MDQERTRESRSKKEMKQQAKEAARLQKQCAFTARTGVETRSVVSPGASARFLWCQENVFVVLCCVHVSVCLSLIHISEPTRPY